MEISPEVQAQLDEQKRNCIFCKIIKGELESNKVYEDDLILGILDINPCTKGHILFLPKEHYPIMPYIPPKTFSHMFGLVPKLSQALKKSMLSTGINVFIANGGIAGQQSPHFLFHMISREKGDGIQNFSLSQKKAFDKSKQEQIYSMLAKNIPLMMRNHFSRNPAKWLKNNFETTDFLTEKKKKQKTLYEDGKVLCLEPEIPQSEGHIEIYSNEEKENIENLDNESSAHLFFTASFCATAVFEGLGAHGTNIILKSGKSQDNPSGELCVHIIPRFTEDGLDLLCSPLTQKPDLKDIASKIKDEMFYVEYSLKGEKKPRVIDLDANNKIINLDKKEVKEKEKPKSKKEEIQEAIRKITNS
jgi:histidine triad (HIT) family protein